jgi:aryl-alcohol dehydrogenase-like predicted oxidoreductase
MKKVQLGNTGERVSQMCLGTMLMGTAIDEDTSIAMLDSFRTAGGDFFDTANCYAWWEKGAEGGESESLLGRWMKARGNRDEIFLATKGGAGIDDLSAIRTADGTVDWNAIEAQYEGLAPKTLRKALEGSLRRLGVDVIDLYYIHVDDRVTPMEDTLRALNDFVQEGKVRYVGCSNFQTWRLERALNLSRENGWAPYVAIQNEYSYFRPLSGINMGVGVHTVDEQLDYLASNDNVTLLAYSPLLKGTYEDTEKRERYEKWPLFNTHDSETRLATLSQMADDLGVSNHQLVLAWLLHHQPRVIPIVGASGLAQLEHNLGSVEIELSDEQMAALTSAGV